MKHIRIVLTVVLIILIIIAGIVLNSCASLDSLVLELKGELIGNNYQIWEYDNFGNQILTLHGNKISIDGGKDSNLENSSYIDIAIDGYEWNHVGGTLVFAQDSVDMITDFKIPDHIEVNQTSTGLTVVDRVVNNYRNMIGKKLVVVIYSQTGTPICIFQGDNCYTKVPADLPKTTMIYIDGALVYVHRANIDIFPAELFNH